jgi:hypothetical protein
MTNATEPSVLLSTFDGGYRVKRLGQRNWNHSVEIVKNSNSVDIVYAGFVRDVQAFRYQNNDFFDISSEYRSEYSGKWGSTFRAIPNPSNGIVEQFASAADRMVSNVSDYQVAEWGIRLLKKDYFTWSIVKEFWQKVDFTVNWLSWQLTSGTNSVVTVNNKQYFGGAYDEMCVMPPLVAGGPRLIIAKMGAAKDSKGRVLSAGQAYSELEAVPANFFNFFEINSATEFRPLASPIVNEETQSNFNFFDCKDINNDGLPDLVSYAFTRPGFSERVVERGKPTIYLNNGRGQLVKVDLGFLPRYSSGNELQSVMVDVYQDGIIDLLLFGSTTDFGGGNIEIHLLNSDIRLP